MFKLTAKVCDDENAGTDHTVKLRFKRYNGGSCVTEELDDLDADDWEQGSTKTWTKLGKCANFRAIKGLKCKFELLAAAVARKDPLKMCKLTVYLGSGRIWEWRGPKEISSKDEESENWFDMQRII